MEQTLAIDPDEVLGCSAKTGLGCEEVLEAIIDRVPAPDRRPRRAAAGDGLRRALRRVPRRDHLRPRDERHGAARARRSGSCRPAPTHEVVELGQFAPAPHAARRSSRPARSATSICNIKSLGHVHIGDTVSVARRRAGRAAARLPGAQADGLLRPLPVRRPGLRAAARGARQAADQRPQLRVRAGDERRPGLRLPLRLPRPAAHGDRPAAARSRRPTSTSCRPPRT